MANYAPLLERAFTLQRTEGCSAVDRIEGEIPEFIQGTYYINGPGAFARSDLRYRHWLDGDGLAGALHFDGGSPRFTNRFIRTAKFLAEQAADRPLFRTFGTAFDSDLLKRGLALESPANVSIYSFARKLLAFGEQSLPYELDPDTLETRGPCDFNCQLNELSAFAAHPKFDPATGEMFNFGISFASAQTTLNVYAFDADASLRLRSRHRLRGPHSIHDCGLSEHFVVFYLSPYFLDLGPFLKQGRPLAECLQWRPEQGSQLLVISRQTGSAVASVPVGNRFCLHLTNCFEESGRLCVDVVELDRPVYDQYQPLPDMFLNAPKGGPVRFTVDLETQTVTDRVALPYDCCPDFPSIDPGLACSRSDDFWMLGISATSVPGRKFFDELVHLNWRESACRDIYRAPEFNYLCGEPAFIGDPRSNQAVVVIEMFDACRLQSAFALFDAFDVGAGPIARIHLDQPVPLGFHTTFIPKEERAP